MEKTYTIGGKKYVQRPIVLGQFQALTPIVGAIEFKDGDIAGLIGALGERLPQALAVVLIEDGAEVREAMTRLDDRTQDLTWSIDGALALEVIQDFFECNPVSSVLEKLAETMTQMAMQVRGSPTPSSTPSSSSRAEQSGDATNSSGELQPESPSSGSDTVESSAPPSSNGS